MLFRSLTLLTLTVPLLGMVLRILYLMTHEWNGPNRRDVQTFTRIKLYDQSMLYIFIFVSLLVRFLMLKSRPMAHEDSYLKQLYFARVFCKLGISSAFFLIYFHTFATFGGWFDPSGHVICGIITCANWLNLILFLTNY
jgi:hypothetical protein